MNFYHQLPPTTKKYINIGLIILLIVVLYSIMAPEQKKTERAGPATIKSVFTTGNDRRVSLDAMSARIKITEGKNDDLVRDLDRAKAEIERLKDSAGVSEDTQRQLAQLRAKQERIEKAMESSTDAVTQLQKDVRNGVPLESATGEDNIVYDDPAVIGDKNVPTVQTEQSEQTEQAEQTIFETAPLPNTTKTTINADGTETTQAEPLSFVDVSESGEAYDAAPEEAPLEQEGFYIPMGSVLSGVLLNGLDAPTGVGANRDPFPVVLRLQKEAVLPNNFSADVIDCHAIMSGYGDLSSERVILRAEGIACVREDGQTIEANLEGYAAGTDGKAGLRGRLVTKQSQLIARSLMAGMASGLSNAFSSTPIPVVNTGSSDTINYTDTLNSNTVTNGLIGGTQSALDKASDWFLKFADAMTPVLELDAAREVDLVLTRGVRLVIK